VALTPFWPFGIPLSRSPGEGYESDKREDREYGKFAWVMDPDGNKSNFGKTRTDSKFYRALPSVSQAISEISRQQFEILWSDLNIGELGLVPGAGPGRTS
jgi:hypothetical protein